MIDDLDQEIAEAYLGLMNAPQTFLAEMAIHRKQAVSDFRGMSREINTHLIKYMTANVPPTTRTYWIGEIANLLDQLAEIRIKPKNRTFSPETIFTLLYDERFGGNDVGNVMRYLERIGSSYDLQEEINAENISTRLIAFHRLFAQRCSQGISYNDLRDLVREHL